MTTRLRGLVAATHTPFLADGGLNLSAIEAQAEHLSRDGVRAAFIGGSTGECHSLTVEERLALARRWSEVVRGSSLGLVVHVGSNCLADARALASQAEGLGASALSALAPSYFKPRTLEDLVACCAEIAGAAPSLPFYFYDIPAMTGVRFDMPEFLGLASGRIPNLAGLKFTNVDLKSFQICLDREQARFDILWGVDESLLAALSLGASGAVGSSYNFAASVYLRMMAGFSGGDLPAARAEQLRSIRLIELLARFGYLAAAKAVMGFLGVEVGPARLPNGNLTPDEIARLRADLERIGFEEWARA